MAIDQTTLSEEQPSPDVLDLIGGIESGKYYVPDESPYMSGWLAYRSPVTGLPMRPRPYLANRLWRDAAAKRRHQSYSRRHPEEYKAGGPYATVPDFFNAYELFPGGGFKKVVNRRDPLGIGFETASLIPGGKPAVLGLAALKNSSKYAKVIRDLPQSVYKKMRTPLKSRTLRNEGKGAFSYTSDKAFANKNYFEPIVGKAQAAKYEYAVTHEGKHYFKHKTNGSYKAVNSADSRIKENLRLHYKGGVEGDKAARAQKIMDDADLVRTRKWRLQTEHAADDLNQLRDPTLPPKVRAATLERYKEYPEAVKLEAMKLLDDIGGPAGGAGAGLPSLLNPARFAANRAKVAGETGEKTVILYHRGPKGIDELKLTPDKLGGNKNALFFLNKPTKSGFGDVLYKVEATLPAGSSVKLGNPSKELIKNLDIAIAKAMEPYAAIVKQGGTQPFEVTVLRDLRGILKGNKYFGGTSESRALMREQGHVRSLEPIQQEFLLSQGVKHLDGLSKFGHKISIVLDPDILKIVK